MGHIVQAAPVCIRKQARGNVAGGLAVVSFKSPFLPPDANWLGGTRRESNEFAEYELLCLFLPVGKNRRRTGELFQPPRANFPVRPGRLVRDVIIAVGEFLSLAAFFYAAGRGGLQEWHR